MLVAICHKHLSASDQLIEVRAGFSVRHLLLFLSLFFFAFVAVWLSGVVLLVRLALSVTLFVLAWRYYSAEFCKKYSRSMSAIRYHQGVWHAFYDQGWHRVWLKGERLVLPELISLSFVDEVGKGGLRINLFSDSDSPKSIHALRLRLLLEKEKDGGNQTGTSRYQ